MIPFLISIPVMLGLITLAHLGGTWTAVAVGLAWIGGGIHVMVLDVLRD